MWELMAKKEIISADGVTKDLYSWYFNGEIHIFMLGYDAEPDPEWCDWSEETYKGARAWYEKCDGWILDI